jgi:glycosyltransferase involved in cell wall biosynthesis
MRSDNPLTPLPDIHGSRRPFFSVICCTFQRAALLARAISSLVRQTEQDWELVVVDDGSTDDTWNVVQNYAAEHPSIRYLYHSNRGVSRSRNAGLLASTGLFVTFLDCDDEYLEDHLAVRRTVLLENPEVTFLHSNTKVVGNPYVPDKNDPSQQIHLDDCVIGGTFVIRRDVLMELGGFDVVDYADDALLYERAEAAGLAIARLDYPSYVYYRTTPDSMCSTHGS